MVLRSLNTRPLRCPEKATWDDKRIGREDIVRWPRLVQERSVPNRCNLYSFAETTAASAPTKNGRKGAPSKLWAVLPLSFTLLFVLEGTPPSNPLYIRMPDRQFQMPSQSFRNQGLGQIQTILNPCSRRDLGLTALAQPRFQGCFYAVKQR